MALAPALPRLRGDLALLPGGQDEHGAPSWLVHDPLANRYYRIGALVFTLLRHWHAQATPDSLLQEAGRAGLAATPGDVDEVAGFLQYNGLAIAEDASARNRLLAQRLAARQHWGTWLIHHYLFFRIPLWHPDHFLQRTLPVVRPLFGTAARTSIALLGLVGILLASRQWAQFQSTFMHFFSWDGALLYALTLTAVKCLHELGHAYTAKHHGCRVPAMGIAFLVLLPLPYTDASDAWKLPDRRQRLAVSTAGVRTELALALIATFLWSFLPDGPLRSATFFVATVSWVGTLIINASPFLRFDGYYALMDWLGTDNLQPRAFALARWQLRELLFDLGEPPPEILPLRRRRLFIGYAWCTWIYRAIVFVGIAFLVYALAFKLLGILLFAVEIGWFILLPLQQEVRAWWQRRHTIPKRPRARWSLFWLILVVLLCIVPWRQGLPLPAVVEATQYSAIHPPVAAYVQTVHVARQARVAAGTPLVTLESPDIRHEMGQTSRRISLLQERIRRHGGSPREREQLAVLQQELAAQQTSLRYEQARTRQLVVRAPFAGILHDLVELKPGQWVARETRLAEIVAPGPPRVYALVEAPQLARVAVGNQATFFAQGTLGTPLPLTVTQVDITAMPTLPYPALAESHGGKIAVRVAEDGGLYPEQALYRVTLSPTEPKASFPAMQLYGTVMLEADPESLVTTLWRSLSATLVRESGF